MRLLPFLLLAAVFCTSCTTLSNRRDLFRPTKPDGPYTQALKTGELPDDDGEDAATTVQ